MKRVILGLFFLIDLVAVFAEDSVSHRDFTIISVEHRYFIPLQGKYYSIPYVLGYPLSVEGNPLGEDNQNNLKLIRYQDVWFIKEVGQNTIATIIVTGDSFQTGRGLRVGMELDDIRNIYGKVPKNELNLIKRKNVLSVKLFDDSIGSFWIYFSYNDDKIVTQIVITNNPSVDMRVLPVLP